MTIETNYQGSLKSPLYKKELNDIDLFILIELAKPLPLSLRSIGKIVGRSHVTISQHVKYLVRIGLVVHDEPHHTYVATEEGKKLLDELKPNKSRLEDDRVVVSKSGTKISIDIVSEQEPDN